MELYAFGSVTSGKVDEESDVDILAIISEASERQVLPQNWCIYSRAGIREIFQKGTLFAWHLHESAIQLWPQKGGLLKELGPPSSYSGAQTEIAALITVAVEAVNELTSGTASQTYELGLLYVAARDVAMAAAPQVLGHFDFSRYAPFSYPALKFPLSLDEYRLLMKCRRAGPRGSSVVVDQSDLSSIVAKCGPLLSWLRSLYERTIDGEVCGEDATSATDSKLCESEI